MKKTNIGASDYAYITYTTCGEKGIKSNGIRFGKDGFYNAYITNKKEEIPKHYILIENGKNWIKLYDDEGLTKEFKAKTIEIYRAGEMGCLIYLSEDEKNV